MGDNVIPVTVNIKITDPLDAAFLAFADGVDARCRDGMSPHDAFVASWKAEVEKRLRPIVDERDQFVKAQQAVSDDIDALIVRQLSCDPHEFGEPEHEVTHKCVKCGRREATVDGAMARHVRETEARLEGGI